jgi:ABC-type transporter Mla maintaining outer membrane lipid asymmetry ATPase subunit MlaF
MNVNKTTTKTDQTSEVAQDYAIELVEVTKQFGDNVVLHGISLDIPSGEFLVLLGPSGCGKALFSRSSQAWKMPRKVKSISMGGW